ncbi:MAG: BREX system serine/threonine kinase PglW [Acidobacteria bacterium]|nr:MAG: BREX system serine/threonine kinase PglW [Acidobacteriota bacterium]
MSDQVAVSQLFKLDASGPNRRPPIDRPTSSAIAKALDKIGLRPAPSVVKVGQLVLGELLYDDHGYQDYEAVQEGFSGLVRRVRVFTHGRQDEPDERRIRERAARREFKLLHDLHHPNIVRATEYHDHELGPTVVFEHVKGAQRLDAWLADRARRTSNGASPLSLDTQLHLATTLADTIHYAHQQGLHHRGLNPRSVWVLDPDSETPKIQIADWFLAHGDGAATTSKQRSTTTRIENLIDDAVAGYLAPELFVATRPDEVLLDVFSLGALFYLLFTGRHPASSRRELSEKLAEGRGLLPSTVVDGIAPAIDELVGSATAADASARLASTRKLLAQIEAVQDELTRPDDPDLFQAPKGTQLAPGITVLERLGKGATALAYRVECEALPEAPASAARPRQAVLKVAIDPEHNARLQRESEALKQLRHPCIAQCYEVLEIQGHTALLLELADLQTLDERIREIGPQTEYLQRFGAQLLEAVRETERQGIAHRDIKPANLGVAERGKNDDLQLLLFDFSLVGTPTDQLHAGTAAYLDPFLGSDGRRRWDQHAERYSAAVTLYEMATGSLPVWGDGRSNPAHSSDEVDLSPERFEDPALRAPLAHFFRRAFARSVKDRFDTTEQMLTAWNDVFRARAEIPATAAAQPAASESTKDSHDPLADIPADERDRWVAQPGGGRLDLRDVARRATPDTQLQALDLSVRAINALSRREIFTVAELLAFPLFQLNSLRGVGTKTRSELTRVVRAIRDAHDWAGAAAAAASQPRQPSEPSPADDEPAIALDTKALDKLLFPRGRAKGQRPLLEALLSWPSGDDVKEPVDASSWKSQTDAAAECSVTRARAGQVVAKARQRWKGSKALQEARERLAALLEARGGVETTTNLASELAAAYGAAVSEPLRTRLAHVVLRAAHEAEHSEDGPRWRERRRGRQSGPLVLLALDQQEVSAEARFDGALALGRRADRLCQVPEDESGARTHDPPPVVGPEHAEAELRRAIEGSPLASLSGGRLRQLAADCSEHTALSARGELYPRRLSAGRAFDLARGSLVIDGLSPQQLIDRVAARYPEAERLPGRPELDALLQKAGIEVFFENGRYKVPAFQPTFGSLTGKAPSRRPTRASDDAVELETVPDEHVERAQSLEERLERFVRGGDFLVLGTQLDHYTSAAGELERFDFQRVDFERAFLETLRAKADELEIDWQLVLSADALRPRSGSAPRQDWANLTRLVGLAFDQLLEDLAATPDADGDAARRPLLLYGLGPVARYDRLPWLAKLRQRLEDSDPPRALCLLLTGSEPGEPPRLDGHPVPVLSPAQWAHVPEAWVKNQHRAG